MKNKWMKITLITALTCLAVGGICLGAGVAMGGSPAFYYDGKKLRVKENAVPEELPDHVQAATKTGTLRNLDISLMEADLEIVTGNDYMVEYVLGGYRTEPEYSIKDGTLKIKEGVSTHNNTFHWNGMWGMWGYAEHNYTEPYVKITIPENKELDTVIISDAYGDIRIKKNLLAGKADIHTENGEVQLDGWKGNQITFDMMYGDLVTGKLDGKTVKIEIENGKAQLDGWKGDQITFDMMYGDITTGRLDGRTVKIDSENGSVSLDALSSDFAEMNLLYGDLTAGIVAAEDLEIDAENGNITLYLKDTVENTGVSLHTDYGTIRTPDGMVEQNDYEQGADFIRTNGDSASVRVYSSYGDIRIREGREL